MYRDFLVIFLLLSSSLTPLSSENLSCMLPILRNLLRLPLRMVCGFLFIYLIKSTNSLMWPESLPTHPVSIIPPLIPHLPAMPDFSQFSKHAKLLHTLWPCPLSSLCQKCPYCSSWLLFTLLYSAQNPLHQAASPGFCPILNFPSRWSAVAIGIPAFHLSVSSIHHSVAEYLPKMQTQPHLFPA